MVGILSFKATCWWTAEEKRLIADDPLITNIQCFPRPCIKSQTSKTIDNLLGDIEWANSVSKKVRLGFNFHEMVEGRSAGHKVYKSADIFSLSKESLSDAAHVYLQAIKGNLDKIDLVFFSWSSDMTCGAYNRWLGGCSYGKLLREPVRLLILPMLRELGAMASFVPFILKQKKFAICCVEASLEREAYLYQGQLEKAPVLSWLKKNNAVAFVTGGSWALYPNGDAYDETCKDRNARSPIFVNRGRYDAGEYPYEYYQDYLKQSKFESGIGYQGGIGQGNAQRLLDLGYAGSYFFFRKENLEAWRKFTSSI